MMIFRIGLCQIKGSFDKKESMETARTAVMEAARERSAGDIIA